MTSVLPNGELDSITENSIKNEVEKRGWKFEWATSNKRFYRITTSEGAYSVGTGSRLGRSGANGRIIAQDKFLSYDYLKNAGYNVPEFELYENATQANDFLTRYASIVVKPLDSEQSKGVTVGVRSKSDLMIAYKKAHAESQSGGVILQKELNGKLYRLLVVGDRLFAAAYRRAAFVTGNGRDTVRALINEKNAHPWRSDSSSSPLKKISLSKVEAYMGVAALEEILRDGEEKEVLAIASVSLGGEAEDVTTEVHPELAEIAVSITRGLGLSICGFDLMLDDITAKPALNFFPLVEFNSLPGFKLHIYPTAGGVTRDPSAAILDLEFNCEEA